MFSVIFRLFNNINNLVALFSLTEVSILLSDFCIKFYLELLENYMVCINTCSNAFESLIGLSKDWMTKNVVNNGFIALARKHALVVIHAGIIDKEIGNILTVISPVFTF